MGLEAMWQHFSINMYQAWTWLKYQTDDHPFFVLGALVVFFLAWRLYRIEITHK
jgi:hypothetical protein